MSVAWTRRQIVDALGPIAPVSIEADVRAAALAEAASVRAVDGPRSAT